MLNIYYMRSNHTFIPLPMDREQAKARIIQEFKQGQSYGMLCAHYAGAVFIRHAKDRVEPFLSECDAFYDEIETAFDSLCFLGDATDGQG